ncbi:MAG: LutC/YkgG family protein [Propionibacteriaceae bacterium]
MNARDEILSRIKTALVDIKTAPGPVDRTYGKLTDMPDVLGRFVERVEDYKATVVRCSSENVGAEIVTQLRNLEVASVALPPALPWAKYLSDFTCIDSQADKATLNHTDAVVTAAAVGIAETGTIILDHGPDQGPRALTLVPDRHICVVNADQVVSDVPEAVQRLVTQVRDGRPLTWVSGPSATSDIELSRVEGVHGPRTLVVIVAE